ncbi:MAG: PspC domain-containing protein [Syntrophothermus sp.]
MRDRLYRNRRNKMIAGVAMGLAEYFDIDPVIVRILFVASAFISGIGFLVYLLLWIVVPYKDEYYNPYAGTGTADTGTGASETVSGEPVPPAAEPLRRQNRSNLFGYVLIGLGVLFMADRFMNIHIGDFWPVILIAIGAGLLLKGSKNSHI